MGLLEKLGLGQKAKTGAPVIGEKKKKKEAASSLKTNKYIRALILIGFLGILISSVPRTSFKEPINYTIGEPWRAEDLTAPFTFALKKTQPELEKERQKIRQSTPPIFHVDHNAKITIQSRLDSLFKDMQPVLKSYLSWQQSMAENNGTTSNDSLRFVQEMNVSNLNLSEQSWQALLENYAKVNRAQQNTGGNASQFVGADLKLRLENLINEVLEEGVINVEKDTLSLDEITVRDLKERTERTYSVANVRDIQEVKEYARFQLSRSYFDEIATAGSQIFNQVIQPNLIFNQNDTQARITEALSNISTTKGAVSQGQVIIRKGDLVNQEKANWLESLAEARAQNASDTERWLRYLGDILSIFAITTVFFFYLYLYRRYIFENNAMLLLVFIAMSVICVASSITYELNSISPYIVPVAVAPIILTIIFDSRVGLLSTICLALLTGLIIGNNFEYVAATTVACSLGLFSVRDIKKRSQFFFITPGIVFTSYAITMIGFNMTAFEGWTELGNDLLFVVINAIFILFTYPLILLFEKVFKVTTDFTLLELSDTNLPLLKDLMTKAPGTFHHSLQVANLSEAAAGSIGANGLLCRVGALYHDIGKMENPGYFVENQAGPNEHDKLKPRMSALVIKAHVSNGVKVAKEEKLPEVIIDFIKTHHGTSLIKFFFEKAKENADEDKDEIQEKDFRYDGPLPRTKETGILLLADGVEAASRAMKDPSYQKLENLVNKMVDDRVNEGQLSRCPLTFQDLRSIKETFLNILMGIYHSRVEYPDDKKAQDAEQVEKMAKDTSITDDKSADLTIEDSESPEPPKVDDYINT
ncbi:HDIG domain-containing protein [Aliifodinibius sp. S!AR15-10]|uniref:HD family phosphohydrolase n=1 Tax=Aliifodinibius sp. S!AR15-10 TaxID=2950437 RepID=UPI00285E143C|nr:HDIG domain-containing metalloprotein [Aliifodinibius sp. S!AR15-10]MDR8391768.1 HDIG domain-containing protein [Aliifodinibius sp. S!AR15-10]